MPSVFPSFFESNEFFIDEKVNFFKFENAYKVYDGAGTPVGNIVQQQSGWHKFLRVISNVKPFMPFTLHIKNMEDEKLVTIHRGWRFMLSKITITNVADNSVIGHIHQKFKWLKPEFRILDAAQQEIAHIKGDWKAWNFNITSQPDGAQIGTITKKWAGAMKELFTTADKYVVSINPEVAEDARKIAIVSCAITIDMVLKEGNGK